MRRSAWRPSGPGLVGALMVAAAAAGCDGDPASPEASALASARARWESAGPSAYEYLYRMSCFCAPQVLETARVRVTDGEVTDVYLVESDVAASPDTWGLYATIDGLFDRLAQNLAAGPAQFEVTYDGALGYPTTAVVDISEQIADEEYSFTASDLVALDP